MDGRPAPDLSAPAGSRRVAGSELGSWPGRAAAALRRLLLRRRRPVAAALVAAAAVIAVQALSPSPPPTVPVVVAARDLPGGQPLSGTDLAVRRAPPASRTQGSTAHPEALAGRVLAGPVRAGEPITDVRLVGPHLVDLLPPGTVAAPLRLSDPETATMLVAGTRVDVLAGPSPDALLGAGPPTAERIASGALVLAVPTGTQDDGLLGGAATPPPGLVLVAVDDRTALRLAELAGQRWVGVAMVP